MELLYSKYGKGLFDEEVGNRCVTFMENGEWRVESGEWRIENGEWRMENGEWRMENGEE
ncbi:MAG: hypothetical protein K0R65_1526 [Crocinitomicaceae bacterium]|jgi:hypothetical protein|nr:hypothetical protein [Crocinitomicaceae bacterium]